MHERSGESPAIAGWSGPDRQTCWSDLKHRLCEGLKLGKPYLQIAALDKLPVQLQPWTLNPESTSKGSTARLVSTESRPHAML